MSLQNILNRSINPDDVQYAHLTVNTLKANSLSITDIVLDPLPPHTEQPYDFLVVNPTTKKIMGRPAASVPHIGLTIRSALINQTLVFNIPANVLFDGSLAADVGVIYHPGTGTFEVVTTGRFMISYTLTFELAGSSTRWGWIEISSTGIQRWGSQNDDALTTSRTAISGSAIVPLLAGATFSIVAFHNSALPPNIDIIGGLGPDICSVCIQRISTSEAQ